MTDPFELINRYFDDELSPEEFCEFEIWLTKSEANRKVFAREAHTHRQIHEFVKADQLLKHAELAQATALLTSKPSRSATAYGYHARTTA